MICGQLSNLDSESKFFSETMLQSLRYLKDCNFDNLENERCDIDGENIFMLINGYETKNPLDKKAEQHKLYIDIHYIISGQEQIGFGRENENNQASDEYDLRKDCTLFRVIVDEVYLPLKKGAFAVFFPADIHRPGLDYEGKHNVRKAVIKIKI